MKNVLKYEELGMFCLSLFLFNMLGFPWWIYVVFIFVPEVSMLGYLGGSKSGALIYNIFHHKGIAIIIYLLGTYTFNYFLVIAGLIIFGNSSLNRFLGLGLKYSDSFKHTHLENIGKTKTELV